MINSNGPSVLTDAAATGASKASGASKATGAHSVTPDRPRIEVPLADLKLQYARFGTQVLDAVREVIEGTTFILGPKTAEFEKAFAAYCGVKHCIAVNSGTSALHLALICADVKAGDEVITTPMTFIATSWAISYCGATPVFVDVDPVTCTIDPEKIEAAITPKTKAILPVHLYGQPADMSAIMEISRRRGIPVVEDCAQAHGANVNGKPVGTIGHSGCFSFYPGKNLGAYGEAGAVVTNDDADASRMRALRDHAQSQRYQHDEIGYNYRMDGIQGAVLGIKMKYIAEWTASRQALAARYLNLLADLPIALPAQKADRAHVWHLFVCRHPQRDAIREQLESRGIQSGLHYPIPLHLQKAYAHLGGKPGDFPVSEQIGRTCLTLPLFAEMTAPQQNAVVDALTEILN